MQRKSKRSFTVVDIDARVKEALFLFNEGIAIEYVWKNLLRRGLKILKVDAMRVIPAPNLALIKDNLVLARRLLREMKSEGGMEYVRSIDEDGNPRLDDVFIKHVLKHGFTHAYMINHV